MKAKLGFYRLSSLLIVFALTLFLTSFGCGGGGGGGSSAEEPVGAEPAAANVSGTWHLLASEQGQVDEWGPNRLIITQNSPDFTFTLDFIDGETASGSGDVSDSDITFSWEEDDGTATCEGTVNASEDTMTGTWTHTAGDSGNWRAERAQSSVWIDWAYVQFRDYINPPRERFQGYLELSKDGNRIEENDIIEYVLKDSEGDDVPIDQGGFNSQESSWIWGGWNSSTSSVDFEEREGTSGFWMRFGVELPPDQYTYEVTTAEGVVLKREMDFPGREDLPNIEAADMNFEWLADGAMKMSWEKPLGNFDEYRVLVYGDGKDLFIIKLPPNVEEVTIPREWVDKVDIPSDSQWHIQTRGYDEGLNYARGYSDFLPVPDRPPVVDPPEQLTISDLDFPSIVNDDTVVDGSVAYTNQDAWDSIAQPVMALRFPTIDGTHTTYVVAIPPTASGNRIYFKGLIPKDVRGTSNVSFKMVDFVQGENNWDDNGVSNVLTQQITIL